MLPGSVQIGNVNYRVERVEPSQDLSGETEWRNGRIVVHPKLTGEMAVGVFLHEVTHALVYAAGQHNDKQRGEDYVSNVGHVVHELARSNPGFIRYLTDGANHPMPHAISMTPYELEVRIVPAEELDTDELSSLSVDELHIRVAAGLHSDMAAWEITNSAVAFGCYRSRATEIGDRYADMVFPVAGLFVDTLRRNPGVTELLLNPVPRQVPLQIVDAPEAGGLSLA